MRTRHRVRPAQALVLAAVGVLLAACGSSPGTADEGAGTPEPTATEEAADDGAGTDFCAEYRAAGGTLATPRLFQVGMSPEPTIEDLTGRVEVLDAVTPPDAVAADWGTLRSLFAEALAIAEATPADGVVAGARVFEIVEELEEPGEAVGAYLAETC